MYKKILVKELIEEGRQLLSALERKRFPIHAALWFYAPESSGWRLLIVSPTVDRKGPLAAYTRLQDILATISPSHLEFRDIKVMGTSNQDYKEIRSQIPSPRKSRTAKGQVSNVAFEDAYLYQW